MNTSMQRMASALCGAAAITSRARVSALHKCKAQRLNLQSRSVLTIKKSPILATKPAPYIKKPQKAANDTDASKSSNQAAGQERKGVRLAKRIAMSGLCSRREAEKYIESHDVSVNGRVVTDLATVVDVKNDVVIVDGRTLVATEKLKVWMANKLAGELVTTSDPQGRPTIFDRLKVMGLTQHIMPVVRALQ
ncbi:Rna pseudouridine synthase, partial [Globisporangium splendens]